MHTEKTGIRSTHETTHALYTSHPYPVFSASGVWIPEFCYYFFLRVLCVLMSLYLALITRRSCLFLVPYFGSSEDVLIMGGRCIST